MWETLPFAVQVRARKTGERFRRTLVRLRLDGMTWKQVARRMRVGVSTLRDMWYELKRSGRIKYYR